MMPRHQANHVTEPGPGLWWCGVCAAPADLEDPGEAFPRCVRCGQRKCTWQTQAGSAGRVEAPAAVFVPEEARPAEPERHLPADRRPSLSKMFLEGYHFCLACNTVTELDADECCVLCGSSQVEWRPPGLQEEGKA